MKFVDFSPPTRPALDQQQDALQKGLGRAAAWAAAGTLDADVLLNACLHDQRYDRQCEDERGKWLWTLINRAGRVSQFRDPIFSALRNVAEEQDASQLCALASHFAQVGDKPFLTSLFEFVGGWRFPDSRYLGERELISLAGENAFRFIVELRGQRLADHDWEWDDAALLDCAIEALGEQRAHDILSESTDTNVRRFATEWRENISPPTDPDAMRESRLATMRAISASDAIQAAVTHEKGFPYRGWGMHATESELADVLGRLCDENDPEVIVRLLQVFSNRALPRFDKRLLEFAAHPNADVRRRAFSALEPNAHPDIREFAVQQILTRTRETRLMGLFVKNFQQGDENLFLESIDLPEDTWQRHVMLMDLIDVLEENGLFGEFRGTLLPLGGPGVECGHGNAAHPLRPVARHR